MCRGHTCSCDGCSCSLAMINSSSNLSCTVSIVCCHTHCQHPVNTLSTHRICCHLVLHCLLSVVICTVNTLSTHRICCHLVLHCICCQHRCIRCQTPCQHPVNTPICCQLYLLSTSLYPLSHTLSTPCQHTVAVSILSCTVSVVRHRCIRCHTHCQHPVNTPYLWPSCPALYLLSTSLYPLLHALSTPCQHTVSVAILSSTASVVNTAISSPGGTCRGHACSRNRHSSFTELIRQVAAKAWR